MVIIKKESVGSIPLLHICKQEHQDVKRPLMLFVHGFESTKERNVQYGYMLAEKGFRVLLPEAIYHGERHEKQNMNTKFWEIVIRTIGELPAIKDAYVEKGLVDESRIAVGGTSMGGIVTLGAMAKYDWISFGVSMMGTPAYVDFAKYQLRLLEQAYGEFPMSQEQIEAQLAALRQYDVTEQLDSWKPRPLFFWHGKADTTVPYQASIDFYSRLKPIYDKKGIALHYTLDEKAGHAVPNDAVIEMVSWVEKQMVRPAGQIF